MSLRGGRPFGRLQCWKKRWKKRCIHSRVSPGRAWISAMRKRATGRIRPSPMASSGSMKEVFSTERLGSLGAER
jgi:hypothetical protein